MSFLLIKLAEAALLPVSAACLLVAAGLVLSLWRPWGGRALVLGGLVLLWTLGAPAVAERLAAPLEKAFPRPPGGWRAEAAVVLCGTVDLARSTSQHVELADHAERILEGAKLVREGRARWLVISGGSGDPLLPEAREADLLWVVAQECGVPAQSILLERGSRTTAENAALTAKLLKERGIRTAFLVTSALHLPRAEACFRKAGVKVVPYPVDFQAVPPRPLLAGFLPSARGLQLSTEALHEYAGYVVYWLGGRV